MTKQGKLDNKKLAAAMAAVFTCIKTCEEAASAAPAVSVPEPEPVAAPAAMPNVWGLSGRQAMMQANTMMQLRLFK